MAETLLLPLVRTLAGKAGDLLLRQVVEMCGVGEERRQLELKLLAIQSVLADAERRARGDPAVKAWLKALKAAAYDADDVLDKFQYEALRRKAEIRDSMTRKVLSYFTLHSPLLFRLEMSRELKKVLSRIDGLVKLMNDFHFVPQAEVPAVPHPQTHSLVDEPDFVGRDADKEKIVRLLLDQHESKTVAVLPVVGMGGLGKTTLAKQVYNDDRVKKHFQLFVWLCVSDPFEVVNIVRSIIEVATNKKCKAPDNLESLQRHLREVLGRKRYLLILDDVWNEDERKWEELKLLLCSDGGGGSMIVVTSRSDRVAAIMGTLPTHRMACLSEDDSWKLFRRKAFSKGVEEREELVSIGRDIVMKCWGLPLALKTMGGLMSSKHHAYEWADVAESKVWADRASRDEILPVLGLSYDHLSPDMKRCFTFCAIFPKDHQIRKDMLIQLWMANGFIRADGDMDMEAKGEQIFEELAWRSFFQDVKTRSIIDRPRSIIDAARSFIDLTRFKDQLSQQLTVCMMHDLMHDLAKSVVEHECASLQEPIHLNSSLGDVRHLSVFCEQEKLGVVLEDTAGIRTLLDSSWGNSKKSLLHKSKHMYLRALQFMFTDFLHNKMICTKHLRYLDISGSNIRALPEATSILYFLQTLNLNNCYELEQLPENMRYMGSLRHVYLLKCRRLKRMPAGMGQLTCLRTLTNFVVDGEAGRGIGELKNLSLGGHLELYNLGKVWNGTDASEANLRSKNNLDQLLLSWGSPSNETQQVEAGNAQQVLEALTPYNRIKVLVVMQYSGIEFSSWMKDSRGLQNLNSLHLRDCRHCKDLPPIWRLPLLELLYLEELDSLTYICSAIAMDVESVDNPLETFPKLKTMTLSNLPNLKGWQEDRANKVAPIIFPRLNELRIVECPKLASMPQVPLLQKLSVSGEHKIFFNSFTFCESLVDLRIDDFEDLKLLEVEENTSPIVRLRRLEISSSSCFFSSELSKSPPGLWKYFAFVEDLTIEQCDDLVHWPMEELQSLSCLQSLSIFGCEKLTGASQVVRSPSTSSEEDFLPRLKQLTISLCPSLIEFPVCFLSLEVLKIHWCGSLVSLPSTLGNLTKLRELDVYECAALRSLPDGMEGLTALHTLEFWVCPGIESLPEGLQQRLPTLRRLGIDECPSLARRCARGGEYWDLVEHIPILDVPVPPEPTKRSFVKELIPSCR